MGSQVAVAVFPLDFRLRACAAVPTGCIFGSPAAALTLLDDLMANPAVVGTPFCGHKRALHTFFDGCTNHWNHPLDMEILYKKSRDNLSPADTEIQIRGNIRVSNLNVNKNVAIHINFFHTQSKLDFSIRINDNRRNDTLID